MAKAGLKRQLTLFDTTFSSRQSKAVRDSEGTDIPCSSSSTPRKDICADISGTDSNSDK